MNRLSPIVLRAPAEDLCLGFANTRYWRGSAQPTEELNGIGDLLGWLGISAHVPEPWLEPAREAWSHPAVGKAVLGDAIALRETVFRLFAAIDAEERPAAEDQAAINAALAATPARLRLDLAKGGWAVAGMEVSLAALLAPMLWSAGDLLLGTRRDRVRRCANPQCGFLFLDDSKSGNRRWCTMSTCGNRAKAQRHYARTKGRG